MNNTMRLLYITRKFPPMVGGMERVSAALAWEFPKWVDMTLIKWGKSQIYLPFVYVLFFVQALFVIPIKRITHVHIGDPILSPLGAFLKLVFGVHTTITVHGLDIIFDFPGYQLLVPRCVAFLDKVICISEATRKECVKRGIPAAKCVVIPCGVYAHEYETSAQRSQLEAIAGMKLGGKKVIVTVGRLVPRKGVQWFIENVFIRLSGGCVYLVVGEGPEFERLTALVTRLRLSHSVKLLGKLSHEELKTVYNTADLFVMPNIRTKDSIEGFGIVALEAASAGLPVLASRIDGIPDVVVNGKTGYLVTPEAVDEWIASIHTFFKEHEITKKKVREIISRNYSWPKIAQRYLTVIADKT